MKEDARKPNRHDTRESWLRSATDMLRAYFDECGFQIPDNIRFSIGFPSTGRNGKRVGELWHPAASADGSFELFIRADMADPVEVLGVLVHELAHSVLPPDAGHGKLYKAAAVKLGLTGPMRHALPGALLRVKLVEIANGLGPLPHARLSLEMGRDGKGPADRPKKQKARLLKACCTDEGCGYNVRVVAKWVEKLGPPLCPEHGVMTMGDKDAAPVEEEGQEVV